jgi:hypothetical protein
MSLRRLRAAMHPNHDPPDRRPDVTRTPANPLPRFEASSQVNINLFKTSKV